MSRLIFILKIVDLKEQGEFNNSNVGCTVHVQQEIQNMILRINLLITG